MVIRVWFDLYIHTHTHVCVCVGYVGFCVHNESTYSRNIVNILACAMFSGMTYSKISKMTPEKMTLGNDNWQNYTWKNDIGKWQLAKWRLTKWQSVWLSPEWHQVE